MFNKNNLFPIGLIVLLSFAAYFSIFDNEFVWDDHVFILDNPDIRSFSNWKLFFTEDVDGLYRPLRSLHYTALYHIAGKDPFLYHVNGFVLHVLISILVFFIVSRLVKKKVMGLTAALLFAAHPIHTGRVTNITASFDLPGILFLLLAFLLYILYVEFNNNKRYLALSVVFFVTALFFSEEAITFPLIALLYLFCFQRDRIASVKKVKSYLLLFGIMIGYVILRFGILDIGGRIEGYLGGTFFSTMLTMVTVYVKYILLLFFPLGLTLFHDVAVVGSVLSIPFFLSLLALIILGLVLFQFYNKVVLFCVGWFFVTLLPMSNIVPLQIFMAERYLYLASIGFCMLVSYGLYQLFNTTINVEYRQAAQGIATVVFVLLIGFYVFVSYDRNEDWQDNLTLWTKTVETNPTNSRAHDNLGFTYDHLGDDAQAYEFFQKAVKLDPSNYRAWSNYGVALAKDGQYNESIEAFEQSIEIREWHKTYDKFGLVLAELQREEEAIAAFTRAIELKYRYPKAHNDLGTVYGRIGEFDKAINSFNDALIIDPTYAEAHYNLGIVLEFLGEEQFAYEEFFIAARLEPDNTLYQAKIQ